MTFAKATATQKAEGLNADKTRIHYNSHLTLTGIPLEAYDYIVDLIKRVTCVSIETNKTNASLPVLNEF